VTLFYDVDTKTSNRLKKSVYPPTAKRGSNVLSRESSQINTITVTTAQV
jgi:hypothetical protein